MEKNVWSYLKNMYISIHILHSEMHHKMLIVPVLAMLAVSKNTDFSSF